MKKRKNKKIKKNMKYLLTFYVSFYIISLALRNYLEAITKENALLAQLVEHLTLNQGVQGRCFSCLWTMDILIKSQNVFLFVT